MPKSKKGKRKTQCSGRLKLGPAKGDRCKRTAMLAVDEHNNTLTWKCKAHDD